MTLGPNIFVFILPALANKNTRLRLMTVHGNGLYGKIPTELEPIRTLRFILRLPCHIISFSFGNFQKQKLYENRKCSYNILWSVHCSNYQSKNILPGVFPNLNGSLSDRVKLESISNNNLPFRFLKRWVTFTGNSPIEDFLCPNDHRAPSLYFVAFSTYVLRLNLHFLFVGCTQCCKSQSFY